MPHDWIVAVLNAICNGMTLLIPKWPWLLGADHEPWTKLVEPTLHQLVETAEAPGRILSLIMLVESLDHCSNLVKLVDKEQWLCCI
jgi:hypothetical protein